MNTYQPAELRSAYYTLYASQGRSFQGDNVIQLDTYAANGYPGHRTWTGAPLETPRRSSMGWKKKAFLSALVAGGAAGAVVSVVVGLPRWHRDMDACDLKTCQSGFPTANMTPLPSLPENFTLAACKQAISQINDAAHSVCTPITSPRHGTWMQCDSYHPCEDVNARDLVTIIMPAIASGAVSVGALGYLLCRA